MCVYVCVCDVYVMCVYVCVCVEKSLIFHFTYEQNDNGDMYMYIHYVMYIHYRCMYMYLNFHQLVL